MSSAPAAAPVTGAGLDPDGALFNTHTDWNDRDMTVKPVELNWNAIPLHNL